MNSHKIPEVKKIILIFQGTGYLLIVAKRSITFNATDLSGMIINAVRKSRAIFNTTFGLLTTTDCIRLPQRLPKMLAALPAQKRNHCTDVPESL